MKTKLEDYQVAVCEKLDWKIDYGTYAGGEVCVDLEKYSPAGEDFIFTVSVNDFEGDIIRYWQGFDPEDHAKTVHGMRGAPDSLRTLIEDADAIEAMIKELHDALIAVHEGRKTVDQIGEDEAECKKKMNTKGKHILDVTCGNRGIWFDKNCDKAIFCDKRSEDHIIHTDAGNNKHYRIRPDVVCDFTKLPFDDNSFELVVIDPPHAKDISPTCITAKEYGYLTDGWEKMIHDGVEECMRVLKPFGTLIFKWSDVHISTREVINAIGIEPLFGHRSGKKMNTHWMVFMKEGKQND